MANLASSGQISLDDIIKNRTGAAGTNVSLKDESEAFASGSEVDGNVGQTTARKNLIGFLSFMDLLDYGVLGY